MSKSFIEHSVLLNKRDSGLAWLTVNVGALTQDRSAPLRIDSRLSYEALAGGSDFDQKSVRLSKLAKTPSAKPSIPVGLDQKAMAAGLIGGAVIAGEEIDQPSAISAFQAYIQPYFARYSTEIV